MKKDRRVFIFILLASVAILLVSETCFRAVWKMRYHWPIVENYKAMMESAQKYRFNEDLGIIVPLAGATIAHATPEYSDVYRINSINGVGFFDDGLDANKPLKVFVLGDSFTRGVGSKDNLRYGWVELAERGLDSVDLVNVGQSGAGQVTQFAYYDKLKGVFDHQLVILNLFTGGDFDDNLYKYADWNGYFARLPQGVDKNGYLADLLTSFNYRISTHYIAYSPVRLYTVWATLMVYEKLISKYPPFSRFAKINKEYTIAMEHDEKEREPESVKSLQPTEFVEENSSDGRFVFSYDPRLYRKSDQRTADRIARHTADIVNDFSRSMTKEGKRFLLIIHPGKEEVYLYKDKGDAYDFDYTRERFKSYLDRDIQVFDMTAPLRGKAEKDKETLYYRVDGHYTQAGHQAVADLVREYLAESGIQDER